MAGVRLKRLKIDKYRNVAPGTEFVFNDKFNVLLGKNGTGKTTLLRLIAMVVAGRFGALKDEAFALEYELRFGELAVIVRFRNSPTPRRQETQPPLAASDEPQWAYEICIRTGKEYGLFGESRAE